MGSVIKKDNIMRHVKYILTVIFLINIGLVIKANNDNIFEKFSPQHIDVEIKQNTLLILKYKMLDINDSIFEKISVDKKSIEKFIENENKKIKKYNDSMKKNF